jgi:hypothetical protein
VIVNEYWANVAQLLSTSILKYSQDWNIYQVVNVAIPQEKFTVSNTVQALFLNVALVAHTEPFFVIVFTNRFVFA